MPIQLRGRVRQVEAKAPAPGQGDGETNERDGAPDGPDGAPSGRDPIAFGPSLGPQSEAVQRLLDRARRLSESERQRMVQEAEWRAWPITYPVGGSLVPARTTARAAASRAGRGAAVDRLVEAAAAAVSAGTNAGRLGRIVGDAALAVAVADLVEDDVIERLSGPWRRVVR
jgi:hypothetical protein